MNLEKLRRNRGYVLIFAFVVSAAVMPTDAISMAIMAVSIDRVYEVGLFFGRFFLKR